MRTLPWTSGAFLQIQPLEGSSPQAAASETNPDFLFGLDTRIEISVNTYISVLGFYGYIGNIGEISVDIFHQISMRQKLSKIDGNA